MESRRLKWGPQPGELERNAVCARIPVASHFEAWRVAGACSFGQGVRREVNRLKVREFPVQVGGWSDGQAALPLGPAVAGQQLARRFLLIAAADPADGGRKNAPIDLDQDIIHPSQFLQLDPVGIGDTEMVFLLSDLDMFRRSAEGLVFAEEG